MRKMVRAGAGIFDKPEPYKNGPAPQHWLSPMVRTYLLFSNGGGAVLEEYDVRVDITDETGRQSSIFQQENSCANLQR
jgi:hypothetical protein